VTTASSTRPIPVPDAATEAFFSAAKQGKLLIKRCPNCGRNRPPQAERCDSCQNENLEWQEASGKGTIYSFVIMHQVVHPAFKDEVPYAVIVVDLDEGVRFQSNLVGTDQADIRIGMSVEAVFEDLSESVAVPKFRVRR
jgi:uncharacterized OB-fold protein